MKKLKELLFGKRVESYEKIGEGGIHHHAYPKKQPSYKRWCKEFNVGSQWDKKIIHINYSSYEKTTSSTTTIQ